MAELSAADETPDSYWDLLAAVARVQAEMGQNLAAWGQAYEAAGRAFQSTAETLELMADVGRRTERYLRSGPPASVRQALELLVSPWQALGVPPGTGAGASAAEPFARFWELWASLPSRSGLERPPRGESGERESGPMER